MARGGYRQPRNPAPVSGPGAASRRTDGGPGSKRQPVRVATGGGYGTAKQSEQAQQAVPLQAVPDTGVSPNPGAAGPPPLPGPPPQGVFGPTERPLESPLAGMPEAGRPTVDVDAAVRALYSVFPHPQLLKLMR